MSQKLSISNLFYESFINNEINTLKLFLELLDNENKIKDGKNVF